MVPIFRVHLLIISKSRSYTETLYGVVSLAFYSVLTCMESEGILDFSNDTDAFCLHYVFLSHMNRALEEFHLGWNQDAVSTE